jgi:hypothetical protein
MVTLDKRLTGALTVAPVEASVVPIVTAVAPRVTLRDVQAIHDRCHFGVDRTLQLAHEQFGSSVSKKMVKKVVSRCDRCARIDPAITFRWDQGSITGQRVWQRWATDFTHVDGVSYLTVIDVVSGFTMWRRVRKESASEVTSCLLQLFAELGPPESLISDNGTVFQSRAVALLLQRWEVTQEFACAYRAKGNGVIERVHRTVKRSVRRTNGSSSVEEVIFWYNNTSGKHLVSPYELVFCARSRKPGISATRMHITRPKIPSESDDNKAYQDVTRNPFVPGEKVYLRHPDGRCDREWSGPHAVTSVTSSVSVIVNNDGIPRHISHVRKVPLPALSLDEDESSSSDEERSSTEDDVESDGGRNNVVKDSILRRSSRTRQKPAWLKDYDMS